MKMTINEALDTIKGNRRIDCSEKYHGAMEVIENAISKYQKIQEIVRWNNAPSPYYKPDGQLFREIEEVVKDEDKND